MLKQRTGTQNPNAPAARPNAFIHLAPLVHAAAYPKSFKDGVAAVNRLARLWEHKHLPSERIACGLEYVAIYGELPTVQRAAVAAVARLPEGAAALGRIADCRDSPRPTKEAATALLARQAPKP